MANLTRVINQLYCKPWLITPQMHAKLCDIVENHVTGLAHEEEGIVAAFADDVRNNKEFDVEMSGSVAVFDVSGIIGRRYSKFLHSSGVVSIDVLDRMIWDAVADDEITAIVLDFDSPGGTVTGVPEVAESIARATAIKPIIAHTDGMIASAAYWLAAPCDVIFASKSADIGSIGVYSAFLDVSRAFEMDGLKMELFKTGKFKGMGMQGLPLTDEQKALIQSEVDEIFTWFKNAVRANRGAVSDDTMQGQTFFGEEAKRRGLVDKIGTLSEAIDYAQNQTR